MQETQVINQIIWTAFLFLSGATVPLAKFPHWIQGASLFMPATYLATGLEFAATNLATLGRNPHGRVALALGLVVAFEISRQLFRWEPEAKVPGRAKLWVLAAMIPFIAFGMYENAFGHRLNRVQYNFQMLLEKRQTAIECTGRSLAQFLNPARHLILATVLPPRIVRHPASRKFKCRVTFIHILQHETPS